MHSYMNEWIYSGIGLQRLDEVVFEV